MEGRQKGGERETLIRARWREQSSKVHQMKTKFTKKNDEVLIYKDTPHTHTLLGNALLHLSMQMYNCSRDIQAVIGTWWPPKGRGGKGRRKKLCSE